MYRLFWSGSCLYKLTSDINRPYRWFVVDLWVEEISRDIFEVWSSDLYGYWRTRLSSYFGGFVLVGRAVFSLRISKVNRVTK